MKVLAYGERAWLLQCADATQVRSVDAALRRLRVEGMHPWSGIVDIVPAATTVLVTLGTAHEAVGLHAPLTRLVHLAPEPEPPRATVEIPVTYDGPDLPHVAVACGLSVAEVVAAHTSTPWRVAFGGFLPGFAYLADGDPRLAVGRRSSPRTSVPAGSVALADGMSAVYPRQSPGGWQLIGHTRLTLWDPTLGRPALLTAGIRVQFRAVP